jgi:hypothetical protein
VWLKANWLGRSTATGRSGPVLVSAAEDWLGRPEGKCEIPEFANFAHVCPDSTELGGAFCSADVMNTYDYAYNTIVRNNLDSGLGLAKPNEQYFTSDLRLI